MSHSILSVLGVNPDNTDWRIMFCDSWFLRMKAELTASTSAMESKVYVLHTSSSRG